MQDNDHDRKYGHQVRSNKDQFDIVDREVEEFVNGTLIPAMNDIKDEVIGQGWDAVIHQGKTSSSLSITNEGQGERFIRVVVIEIDGRNRASMETRQPGQADDVIKNEVLITRSGEPADLSKISRADIIHLFFIWFGKQ